MTAAIFDFDNDGRADIYIGSSDYPGTRGRLYHQTATGDFEGVPVDVGINHARSQGLTVADFDR
ncbi:MAG: VCBS repeat-containing protein, partial [Proteobacteria bacterium]|nr:VCBS repeat-containing protein [Pseudomonadota bacterium]